MASRPEHVAPPEVFYNEEEASKYAQSTRMKDIQTKMSLRAVELLNIPEGEECFLLDLGCGSGLSGEVLSDLGHTWIGLDISEHMLAIASEKDDGDLVLSDLGNGVPFRPGLFDGAISISALQWLCNADKRWHVPKKRLIKLFETLYSTLRKGAKAVFQMYPENATQIELITSCAMTCGFTGGVVVDYPHSAKAKKYFLVLFAGHSAQLPQALGTGETDTVRFDKTRTKGKKGKKATGAVKSKEWIINKKERQRKQGKEVKRDSKYTGRKRAKF